MGQSLSQLYVHLTFGVKGRKPLITLEIEDRLHAYIIGILKDLESPSLITNSAYDHIHILFRLSKNITLAKVVEEVKKSSSRWIKDLPGGSPNFKWQIGYGAFSVSSSKVEIVKRYIKNQKVHHSKRTYKDEIEEFIKEYDIIEYDENYFWD